MSTEDFDKILTFFDLFLDKVKNRPEYIWSALLYDYIRPFHNKIPIIPVIIPDTRNTIVVMTEFSTSVKSIGSSGSTIKVSLSPT